MSRRYRSEPIEVVADEGGEPAGFRWRGRRYVVSAIVATWVEAVPWWTGRSRVAEAGGQFPAQRQVWRVEAARTGWRTSSPIGSTGTYDLSCTTDGWVLTRVLD